MPHVCDTMRGPLPAVLWGLIMGPIVLPNEVGLPADSICVVEADKHRRVSWVNIPGL